MRHRPQQRSAIAVAPPEPAPFATLPTGPPLPQRILLQSMITCVCRCLIQKIRSYIHQGIYSQCTCLTGIDGHSIKLISVARILTARIHRITVMTVSIHLQRTNYFIGFVVASDSPPPLQQPKERPVPPDSLRHRGGGARGPGPPESGLITCSVLQVLGLALATPLAAQGGALIHLLLLPASRQPKRDTGRRTGSGSCRLARTHDLDSGHSVSESPD